MQLRGKTMGRKKQIGVKRTASGRKSRAADAHQEHVEAILTRMRLFGLSEKDARDQKAATFVGRLQLTKAMTQVQYDAAQEYLRLREAYQRAIKAPDALRSSNGGGDQGESPTYASWCKAVIGKWDELQKAIQHEQSLHRHANFWAALDYLVCRDEQHWHMVGDCRLALNACAHHFGLMGKRKSLPIAA